MEKVEKYIIVSNSYASNITKEVSEKMNEGYTPYGNLIVTIESGGYSGFWYCQPMILKEENEKNTTN